MHNCKCSRTEKFIICKQMVEFNEILATKSNRGWSKKFGEKYVSGFSFIQFVALKYGFASKVRAVLSAFQFYRTFGNGSSMLLSLSSHISTSRNVDTYEWSFAPWNSYCIERVQPDQRETRSIPIRSCSAANFRSAPYRRQNWFDLRKQNYCICRPFHIPIQIRCIQSENRCSLENMLRCAHLGRKYK